MKRLLFVLAILGAIVVMSNGTAHAHRGYRGYYAYPRHNVSYGGYYAHPRQSVGYRGYYVSPRAYGWYGGYYAYPRYHVGYYGYGGSCGW